MIVMGLDVSRLSVTGCLLFNRPGDPREFYRGNDFFEASLSCDGISELLTKKPDLAVLEPTGVHYSRLWVERLIGAGVEVRFVGHDKLKSYRRHLDLPDKDDRADALALGCYGWDYLNLPRRFVSLRLPVISRIRDISLRLHYYARLRTCIINRLKQDLVSTFPEKAIYRTGREVFGDAPPFWRWLAGDAQNSTYERELANSCGLGLSDEITGDSQLLVDVFRSEQVLELELDHLMNNDERFLLYSRVFTEFGFGLRVSSILLSQIFPLSKFLGPDGFPEVKKEKGSNGTYTNRYLSERRFKKMMGLAPTRDWSGDRQRSFKSGNRLCRRVWWQWLFTRIEPVKARPQTEVCQSLGRLLDEKKAAGLPVKKARSLVCAKASVLLFRRLCAVLL